MAHVLDMLRTGAWLTRERVKLVVFGLLAAMLIAVVYVMATSNGLNDRFGRPLGTDFSNVYAAGTYVLDGNAAAPFDPSQQYAREQAIFGKDTPFYGWHYPPYFLGVAALFAAMPYALALALWQGVTFTLYLWVTRGILKSSSWPGLSRPSTSFLSTMPQDVDARHIGVRRHAVLRTAIAGHDEALPCPTNDPLWLPLVLGFPAVFVNLGHGHNGFLTAALFGAALLQLDRRPVLAGILFGCIAYKPQFGLLIPIVLAASGRWRVFTATAATVAI
ncbi:MAG TPA: glycosyltransferase family 87 protein, partial [Pseudolabrys sp.]|nr:glycosyltransferase family 87 protein [Pseudolabrys sp.]